MSDQMARLQQEAEEMFPECCDGLSCYMARNRKINAYIAGRSGSAEQVAAFEAELNRSGNLRTALEAAGLVVEE